MTGKYKPKLESLKRSKGKKELSQKTEEASPIIILTDNSLRSSKLMK